MRGLKDEETVRTLLEGWVVHYNYVRKHQSLDGRTPAQICGIEGKDDWHVLVKEATKNMVEIEMTLKNENPTQEEQPIMVMAK